ncbi:MAG: DUF349 domain-containing protein [Bacteroidales bacterium]|nr:DUF349 domain-containing protein [Bacteroidales bacterium]
MANNEELINFQNEQEDTTENKNLLPEASSETNVGYENQLTDLSNEVPVEKNDSGTLDVISDSEKTVIKTEETIDENTSTSESKLLESDLDNLITEQPISENIEFVTENISEIQHVMDIEEEDEEEENLDYDSMSKKELVDVIEILAQDKNITKIKRKIGLIKLAFHNIIKHEKEDKLNKFIEEGGDKKEFKFEPDNLEIKFNAAFNTFKQNKKSFEEEQENEKIKNFEKKKNILEEIRKLIESEEDLKTTYDEFKRLQSEWKETGPVSRLETDNLWKNYHFLVDKFLDKVRINEELRDLDRKKNMELSFELCEKTEELLLNPKINESFKLLQKYHQEWKEIGPLPSDKKDYIWERFKLATEKVIERRRQHYDKKRLEQENNYAAKVILCEKIEEIIKEELHSNNEWADATKRIQDLQNIWKTIGTAPIKLNDEIWTRFRSAINMFFENKKDYFAGLKEELINNYNLKLDICAQAEAIKDSKDWKKTTLALIKLQQEWKNVGAIPRKHADDLWKRFRAACDHFFKQKQDYFANIGANEKENLKAKLDIIEKIKAENLQGDKKKALDTLNILQREFMAIGHVPANEKDNINRLLRETINQKLDELKINPVEKKMMSFKSKFEDIKDTPDANDIVRSEVRFLNNKLTQLRSDIQLWENNIGFFAKSKSANILKQEFENKIEKAKEEITVLEAKIKFLKQK